MVLIMTAMVEISVVLGDDLPVQLLEDPSLFPSL
jgi:hypothetical protein